MYYIRVADHTYPIQVGKFLNEYNSFGIIPNMGFKTPGEAALRLVTFLGGNGSWVREQCAVFEIVVEVTCPTYRKVA